MSEIRRYNRDLQCEHLSRSRAANPADNSALTVQKWTLYFSLPFLRGSDSRSISHCRFQSPHEASAPAAPSAPPRLWPRVPPGPPFSPHTSRRRAQGQFRPPPRPSPAPTFSRALVSYLSFLKARAFWWRWGRLRATFPFSELIPPATAAAGRACPGTAPPPTLHLPLAEAAIH